MSTLHVLGCFKCKSIKSLSYFASFDGRLRTPSRHDFVQPQEFQAGQDSSMTSSQQKNYSFYPENLDTRQIVFLLLEVDIG